MSTARVFYGDDEIELRFPGGVTVSHPGPRPHHTQHEPLAVVARAIDAPLDAPPLEEAARGARTVAVVVPDGTRQTATRTYLLPVLSRLARAGLRPAQMRIVIARGIHPATSRGVVSDMLGPEVMSLLGPVQSAPESPDLNREIAKDPDLGSVRCHHVVAEADLVVLTGAVVPHHLAGFGGGPKALVPGVADRRTVVAAHRLTLDALVRPDGSVRSAEGTLGSNVFRDALLRVAREFGRAWLLNVVLDSDGRIAAAAAGEVGAAHEEAVRLWNELHAAEAPTPHDMVVGVARGSSGDDLIQGHKALLRAAAYARPGAPIIWLVRARNGTGHTQLLQWFTAGKLPRHLAALRTKFHPYGLTAYSMRRLAKDHPVHIVSEMPRAILRPMGFLPFEDAQAAVTFALSEHDVKTCAVLG